MTNYNYNLIFKPYGEFAILIEWPSKIDEHIIRDILSFQKMMPNKSIKDSIVAYHSLTLIYKKKVKNFEKEVNHLQNLYANKIDNSKPSSKIWQIPVCYDLDFGLDLKELSIQKQLTIDELIQLHTSIEYLVYFIGFLPGFLYLGGLVQELHWPRKATPRFTIDKGAVAIGGQQTGIYPQQSAGGWNIIGKTPLNFFNAKHNPPCFVSAGDKIKCFSISTFEFQEIENQVKKEIYQPKFLIND